MDNEKDAIEREQLPGGKILLRWKPEQGVDYTDEDDYLMQDMAEEYLVIERQAANSGIIVFARYRRRTTWEANPTLRPLVRHLLRLDTQPPMMVVTPGEMTEEGKKTLLDFARSPAAITFVDRAAPPAAATIGFSPSQVLPSTFTVIDPKDGYIFAESLCGATFSAMLTATEPPSVEEFAQQLHEAGREAVLKGATVGHSVLGEVARGFKEWNEITEEAREGRRIQARWLLARFDIIAKMVSVAAQEGEAP